MTLGGYCVYPDKQHEGLANCVTPQQIEIFLSVMTRQRTLVKGGNGLGKSFIAGPLALFWLYTRKNSKVVITSSKMELLMGNVMFPMWSFYDRLAEADAGLFNPVLRNQTRLVPFANYQNWYLTAFTSPPGEEGKFAGGHSEGGTLLIFDEANQIHPAVYRGAEGMLMNRNNHIALFGNPISEASEFFEKYEEAA